ncbi:MAG: bifunctional diaminohydroxyphosphoribosylaminopyrimidine deaminase/5-amino-6-(5-phosphoribosylamino)uracil reductase RibD [Aureispira sp.]
MLTKEEQYMQRAIIIARAANGNNAPNPRVGAVLVYEDRIIGEGYHQQYGQGHAEVNAVAAVLPIDRPFLPKSTLYVTLEPCFHHGKTPPCVQLILKEQIARVVIACRDPFEQVAGQSIALLKAKGVEVKVGVLEKEAAHLTRRFFTNVQEKRPYVVLKYAQSKDGFIGDPEKRVLISNAWSQRLVHQWRRQETAILVGTNTALLDNPSLTNRFWAGRQPLRLVIDRSLRLPKSLALFDGTLPTWVFTTQTNTPQWENVRFVTLKTEAPFLPQLLAYLYQEKIQSLLVEGGAQVLTSFLESNLWDEARILQSSTILGQGIAAPILSMKGYQHTIPLFDNTLSYYYNQVV